MDCEDPQEDKPSIRS